MIVLILVLVHDVLVFIRVPGFSVVVLVFIQIPGFPVVALVFIRILGFLTEIYQGPMLGSLFRTIRMMVLL